MVEVGRAPVEICDLREGCSLAHERWGDFYGRLSVPRTHLTSQTHSNLCGCCFLKTYTWLLDMRSCAIITYAGMHKKIYCNSTFCIYLLRTVYNEVTTLIEYTFPLLSKLTIFFSVQQTILASKHNWQITQKFIFYFARFYRFTVRFNFPFRIYHILITRYVNICWGCICQ